MLNTKKKLTLQIEEKKKKRKWHDTKPEMKEKKSDDVLIFVQRRDEKCFKVYLKKNSAFFCIFSFRNEEVADKEKVCFMNSGASPNWHRADINCIKLKLHITESRHKRFFCQTNVTSMRRRKIYGKIVCNDVKMWWECQKSSAGHEKN